MTEFMIAFFLIFGAGFIFIASLGVLRMPELYMRIHSATKVGTLGVGFLVAAVAFHFQELSILIRALAAISFIVITAPVAAHMIGRAGYKSGVPLWKGMRIIILPIHLLHKVSRFDQLPKLYTFLKP